MTQRLIPMVQAFHQTVEIPQFRRYGGRCPCCADAAGSTGDGPDSAENCLEAPQMHFCVVSQIMAGRIWDVGIFIPCIQVQGRGPCPQGHGPHNKVHLLTVMETRSLSSTSEPQTPQQPQPPHSVAILAQVGTVCRGSGLGPSLLSAAQVNVVSHRVCAGPCRYVLQYVDEPWFVVGFVPCVVRVCAVAGSFSWHWSK